MPKFAALIPHVVFAGIYLLLRTYALGGADSSGDIGHGLPDRLMMNAYLVPRYLGLILFPSGLSISHDVPASLAGEALWLIPAWIAIVVSLLLLLRTGSAPVLFGLLWLVVNYIPISGIVPIPSAPMAERFLYLPAVGLWVIVADRGHALYERFSGGRALAAAAALVLVLLGAVTVHRNQDWKSDLALFGSVVSTDPDSPFGHFNLGIARKDAGDWQGAEREWRETLRLDPKHSGAMTQLGSLAAVRGDLGAAEHWFKAAVDADTRNAIARFNLALVFEKTGRPEEAAAQYDLFLLNVPPEYGDYIPRAQEHRARLRKAIK